MSEVNRRQPETMLEEIVRNDKPSREERDKLAKRKVLIGYAFGLIVCIILNGYLFSLCYKHYLAYVKSSCFILNSTVVETNSQFSARWSVNISQDHFVPHHYLGQINKKFSFYHEAQEIISTTHLIGSQDECYARRSKKYDVDWEKNYAETINFAILWLFCAILLFILLSLPVLDLLNKIASRQIS